MLDVRLKGAAGCYKIILSLLLVIALYYLLQKSSNIHTVPAVNETVHIDVYYEALCPDSRYFFVHELSPAWLDYKEIMDVKLIPYGKATTKRVGDAFEFSCQHGPDECLGNKYHACGIQHADMDKSIKYGNCMIKDYSVYMKTPAAIAQICAGQLGIPFTLIDECVKGIEGDRLIAGYGELTTVPLSKSNFIPTIEIEHSQARFKDSLKNLSLQVCLEHREKFQKTFPKCREMIS